MISLDDIDLNALANRLQNILATKLLQATLAVASEITLTTNTPANVTSLALPAGVHLVWGMVDLALAACTTTIQECAISATSATLPSQAGGGVIGPDPLTVEALSLTTFTGTKVVSCGPTVVNLPAPATIYLVTQATFSAGTCKAYGSLYAHQF